MVIYADVIFLVNFLMDFFILWACSMLLKRKVHIIRLVLAAVTPAAIYVLSVCARVALNGLLFSEVLILVSVIIAFGVRSVALIFNAFALSSVISFALGGVCVALFYILGAEGIESMTMTPSPRNFSVAVLFVATALSYAALKLIGTKLKKRLLSRQRYCGLSISINNKTASMIALIDTGNGLYDPVSELPVIIAEKKSLEPLFNGELDEIYGADGEASFSFLSNTSGTVLDGRLRLLPFSALGKKNGLLVGIRPDSVEMTDYGSQMKSCNSIIGIYEGRLSDDGCFQALANPDVLEEK